MFSALRRRLSYANVAATLALALSMSGVAVAAHGYIVSSTGQLTNKVVKTIKHHGAKGKKGPNGYRGPTGLEGVQGALGVTGPQGFLGPQQAGPRGPAGPAGKERGPTGTAGAPGGATAIPFSAVLTAQALKEPVTKRLFSLPGGIEASLFCARIFFTLGAIDVAAPEGSVAETGSVEFNPEGERPLENARLNELMPLDPEGSSSRRSSATSTNRKRTKRIARTLRARSPPPPRISTSTRSSKSRRPLLPELAPSTGKRASFTAPLPTIQLENPMSPFTDR